MTTHKIIRQKVTIVYLNSNYNLKSIWKLLDVAESSLKNPKWQPNILSFILSFTFWLPCMFILHNSLGMWGVH